MERTLRVTGFSWNRGIQHALASHFSRVAQVEAVSFSPDRNVGFVRLYCRESIPFLLEQEWYLGGERLKVLPLRQVTQNKNSQEPPQKTDARTAKGDPEVSNEGKVTRETYYAGQSGFWADVPHHTFTPVCKKPKRKRWDCANLGPRSANVSQRPRRKRKRSSKKKKQGYLEKAESVPFGICVSEQSRSKKDCGDEQRQNADDDVQKSKKSEGCTCRRLSAKGCETRLHKSIQSEPDQNNSVLPCSKTVEPCKIVLQSARDSSSTEDQIAVSNTLTAPESPNLETKSALEKAEMSSQDSCSVELGTQTGKHVHPQQTFTNLKPFFHNSVQNAIGKSHSEVISTIAHLPEMNVFVQGITAANFCTISVPSSQNFRHDLLQNVSEVLHIPAELLHLSVEGRCTLDHLSQNQLLSGSTLHVSIKGKGGMLDSHDDSCVVPSPAIHASSNDEQVIHWLKETCCLSDEYLVSFKSMNGEVLFQYTDYKSLVEETEVSYGAARKILFLRDNPGQTSRMWKWPVQSVVDFFQQSCPHEDLQSLVEKQIDGAALLSIVRQDLVENLGMRPVLARRILTERDKFLAEERKKHNKENVSTEKNEMTEEQSNPSTVDGGSTTMTDSEINSSSQAIDVSDRTVLLPAKDLPKTIADSQPVVLETLLDHSEHEKNATELVERNQVQEVVMLKENDPLTKYKMFLQDGLSLPPLTAASALPCQLQVIFHKRKDRNALEDNFLFMTLCKDDSRESEHSKRAGSKGDIKRQALAKLWELITDRVESHWFPLLPPEARNKFTLDEKQHIMYQGKQITFEKETAKTLSLKEYDTTVKSIDTFPVWVLLVDISVLQENSNGYIFDLIGRKKQNPYEFGFQENVQYWTFNSDDLGYGFRFETLPQNKIGTGKKFNFHNNVDDDVSKLRSVSRNTKVLPCGSELEAENLTATNEVQENNDEHDREVVHSDGYISSDDSSAPEVPFPDEEKSKKLISPRPFNESHWVYHEGRLDVIETGDGFINRCVELKYQGGSPPQDDLAKRSFLYKSLEFICGCLNARQNGTIYFGVAEGNVKGQDFQDGQICGIELDQRLKSAYYDLFQKYLVSCFNKTADTVRLCVTGPHFIEVKPMFAGVHRFVIEVDVEPSSKQCKNTVFVFYPQSIFDKFGMHGKSVYTKNKKNWTGVFKRVGSETQYVGVQEEKLFTESELPNRTEQRKQKETDKEAVRRGLMKGDDAEKLKKFIGEYDLSMSPLLVLPKLSSDDKRKYLEYFQFIQHIRWSGVFDFDDDSGKDGIYSLLKSNKSKCFDVLECVVEDFNDMSVEERKDELQFPKKTVWLFSNGKSTEPKQYERYDHKKWKKSYWTFLQNAVSFYKDNSVIPPARRMLLIMIGDELTDGIIEASENLVTAFSWNTVLFIFSSEHSRKHFADEVSDDVYKHSVVMPWQHIHFVFCQCLNVEVRNKDKFVCTANGACVPIPSNEWQAWTDLDLLSAKECQEEWESLSKEQQQSKAGKEEIAFYQGQLVSWWNFYLSDSPRTYNHVMKRSDLHNILKHIRKLTVADSSIQRVPLVTLGHMPGAGGTTLSKNVLWEFRNEFKCAVVKKITENTERQIFQLWETAEEEIDQRKRNPVILLANDTAPGSTASFMDESELTRRLFRKQRECNLDQPLAILIHCYRNVKPEGDFKLTQTLHNDEKFWLAEKHEALEQQEELKGVIETFIAFLSLRNEFNQDFLQKTVKEYINHENLEENEYKLIEYISLITTYFPDSEAAPGLPVSSCDGLMKTFRTPSAFERTVPWERTLSRVAQVLLVIEKMEEQDNPRYYVRIASQPYAKVILETVLQQKGESLPSIVIRCLRSPLVLGNSQSNKQVVRTLTQMLIERQLEKAGQLTQLSPLITKIKHEYKVEEAAKVLQEGYDRLGSVYCIQHLARLYITHGNLVKAEQYALQAVQLLPNKREFKHTLGLVYFKMFGSQKDKNCLQQLETAFLALQNFLIAQEGRDDQTLGACYAYTDSIETVNKILLFLEDKIAPHDLYKFGQYLTDEDSDFPEFDEQPEFRDKFKSLIECGLKALRYLYYLGYSHWFVGVGSRSFHSKRDERTLTYIQEHCVRQFRTFSRMLRTFHNFNFNRQYIPEKTANNAYRIENVKLMGCFFESIFEVFTLPAGPKRRKAFVSLTKVHENLGKISTKTSGDKENLISVSLALELYCDQHWFSKNASGLYKMCCEIVVDSKLDEVSRGKAHIYRVLLSWPNVARNIFNMEQFQISFHKRLSPSAVVNNRYQQVVSKAHFFIRKKGSGHYLCHWTDIYGDNSNREAMKEMSERCEPFTGEYKVVKKSEGGQSQFIDWTWQSAMGELKLKIHKVRGIKVFRNERVLFFLGFGVYGPEAFVKSIIPSSNNGEE